ncbi:MAG TPA: hypothetical protein VNK96_04825 [Fimbriimonadales bacterium]|nr:hypothetical protein [Fimbriimonadales bacterium]
MDKIFLSGFGPFKGFDVNPSEVLVCSIDKKDSVVLPVSFDAVDAFLQDGFVKRFDAWLMIGVMSKGERFRLERTAKNWVCGEPDVRGVIRGEKRIDNDAPEILHGSLFQKGFRSCRSWTLSDDAGAYLCNYLYFRALQKYPNFPIGFLHVPAFQILDENTQIRILKRLLKKLESAQ